MFLVHLEEVLLLVNVAIRAIIVLIFKVLEAFLLIERSEKLAISILHMHDVEGEAWQIDQRFYVLALC